MQVTTQLSCLGAGQVPQGSLGATLKVSRALSRRPSQSEPDLMWQDLGHWVGGLGLALLLGHLPACPSWHGLARGPGPCSAGERACGGWGLAEQETPVNWD